MHYNAAGASHYGTQPSWSNPAPAPMPLPALSRDIEEMTAAFEAYPRQAVIHNSETDHLPRPLTGVFHPDFVSSKQEAMKLYQNLTNLIAPLANQTSVSAERRRPKMDSSSGPEAGERCRVAIVGGIGEGKSYLIGTLLGDEQIARYVRIDCLIFSAQHRFCFAEPVFRGGQKL